MLVLRDQTSKRSRWFDERDEKAELVLLYCIILDRFRLRTKDHFGTELQNIWRYLTGVIREFIYGMRMLRHQGSRRCRWCGEGGATEHFLLKCGALTCCRVGTIGSWISIEILQGSWESSFLGCLCWEKQKTFYSIVTCWLRTKDHPSTKLENSEDILQVSSGSSFVGCVCWDTKVAVGVDGAAGEMRLENTFDLLSTPDDELSWRRSV